MNYNSNARRWHSHPLIVKIILLTFAISCTHSAMAQASQTGDQNQTAAEVSKEASNPLSSIWLMQIQQNNTWIGMPASGDNRVQSNIQFQPLMSIKMNDDWSLVTRPVLQLVNTTPFQDQTGKSDRSTGLGDTVLALAVSPSRKLVGNWLLAAGPTFIFPTATDSHIGQDKWQVGPAAAFGYTGKNFVTYVFPQQWFSLGGSGVMTKHMLMYYAFVYAFRDGWSVGTNPAMTVDWQASSGNKVTFPVGVQIGKLRKVGPMPVKFDVQAQYYMVRPGAFAPKWNLQFQVTPILPALIGRKTGRK
jgi:hypothetical protein